jgi:cell division FtsZ-interacting protein ZapD
MFRVAAKRCDECLFSTAKIVSDSRKEAVIQHCIQLQVPFECHKFTILRLQRGGKKKDTTAACRGFFDNYKDEVSLMSVAERLDMVTYIDWDGNPIAPDEEAK